MSTTRFIPTRKLIKLPTATKRAWLRSLRSGDYKQGVGGLRRENVETCTSSYCCLGVLADILQPRAWTPQPTLSGDETRKYLWGKMKGGGILYREDISKKMSEVISQIVTYDDGKEKVLESLLIDMNDSQSMTFEEIANWIEENL